MTDESSDSELEELSDYMSDEENTSENGNGEENREDSNLANAIRTMQKTQHWLNPPTRV